MPVIGRSKRVLAALDLVWILIFTIVYLMGAARV